MYQESLLGKYLEIMSRFENGSTNPLKFFKELKSIFPFDNRVLRLRTWTLREAVFIYYGLNPKLICDTLEHFILQPFLSLIDYEEIYALLENHRFHKVCNYGDSVIVNEFMPFLSEKNVPIPTHLHPLSPKTGPETPPEMNTLNIRTAVKVENDEPAIPNSSISKTRPPKRKKESIRRTIMRDLAELFWTVEQEAIEKGTAKTNKLTNANKLSNSKIMKESVSLINKLSGLKAVSSKGHSDSGVDPEWFSDLFPCELKPGPKRKSQAA